MEAITNLINNITEDQIISVFIAIGIILIFRIFSSSLSYMLVKLFKIKTKKPKEIKESAFYKPLKIFFIILGVYLGIIYLKTPFNISNEVINVSVKLFKILTILVFARGLALSLRNDAEFIVKLRNKLNKENEDSMINFGLKIVKLIIYIIAVFLIITELGFNLNGLIAGLGISGIIITLAAQDTAKNLFGGLVIFLDKPFLVGDWIQLETFEGTVEDITFRSTRIRTFENCVVNIPNANVSNTSIINWSKMEKRRYKTNLNIELNTPLEKLEKFKTRVEEMLQSREAIYDDSIIVKFDIIKENAINMLVISYTDSINYISYLSEKEDINYKIMKILKEENIKLAYDTKTVYIRN